MPGLCGFVIGNEPDPASRLERVKRSLCHHESHFAFPDFQDRNLTASLVLRRVGAPGIHWQGPDGVQVWLDGESFHETGPIAGGDLAGEISRGDPRIWNGTFSAVIYEPAKSRLRFITDPCGLRYLYVRKGNGPPSWSSELSGFLELPGPPLRLNPQCVKEFLDHGFPLGTTTWFQDVELLEPGMELTFDLAGKSWSSKRYFNLETQTPDASTPDWDASVAGLGTLFRSAVARRCPAGERVGLSISGGLDSRALLAAMPATPTPIEALTFGRPGCDDAVIAAKACAVRGAHHTVIPLGEEGWLESRLESVAGTDGQVNLLHLHGLESLPFLESRMDFCLNGFLGDALLGGSYLDGNGFPFLTRYLHRGRRFILQPLHSAGTSLPFRLPFMDVPLLTRALSLPRTWLQGSRIYRAMLLHEFPVFFRDIPWEKTGLPISVPPWRENLSRLGRRIHHRLHRFLGRGSAGYADYAGWLRQQSSLDLLQSYLNPSSKIAAWVDPALVGDRIRRHVEGRDESEMLGRYLTLETWLRKIHEFGVAVPGTRG